MGQILQSFPQLPAHTQTVVIQDAQYIVRLVYRSRTAAWYFDLRTVDGDDLALGRRLSEDWSPLLGLLIDNAPDGLWFVRGPDAYDRDDLGSNLLLMFYELADLPAATVAADVPTVVLS